jgi:NIMA (never in mitosis gene a)-related kinase 1/4/5
VSTAHDLWSLGIIVYQLCTLQHPFHGESIPELFNAIVSKDYKSIPSEYSLNLSQLVSSLLRKNAKNRVTLGRRPSLRLFARRRSDWQSRPQRLR